MKRLLGLAVLILGMSIPAHAQSGGSASRGGVLNGGGGGGYGAGGSMSGGEGKASFPALPQIPRTQFASISISGTEFDFTPSTFLSFDNAVAEGRAVDAAEHMSVVDAAKANLRAPKEKARFEMIEDAEGNPVITRQ